MSFSKERIKAQPATSAATPPEPPKATRPWKEPDLLAPPPGYTPSAPGEATRWVRISNRNDPNDRDRLNEMQSLGWKIWTRPNTKGKAATGGDFADPSDLGSAATRRGLVFMTLSPEDAAARRRYYWEINQQKVAALRDPEADKKMGAE